MMNGQWCGWWWMMEQKLMMAWKSIWIRISLKIKINDRPLLISIWGRHDRSCPRSWLIHATKSPALYSITHFNDFIRWFSFSPVDFTISMKRLLKTFKSVRASFKVLSDGINWSVDRSGWLVEQTFDRIWKLISNLSV